MIRILKAIVILISTLLLVIEQIGNYREKKNKKYNGVVNFGMRYVCLSYHSSSWFLDLIGVCEDREIDFKNLLPAQNRAELRQ